MAVFLIAAAVSIAASAAAAAISSALTPEQVNTERLSKGKQDNFNSPRSSYGDTISRVWGIGRVGGILAQATIPPIERVTEKITRKHQGGKGLGGTNPDNRRKNLHLSRQLRFYLLHRSNRNYRTSPQF